MSHTDEYTAFEQTDNPATRAFAAQADAATRTHFADAGYTRIRDDITALLQDEQQIPFCREYRAQMYHFYQSADYPKGVYRVCPAASYRAGLPEWKVLFSVADFDDILGDDVYFQSIAHFVNAPEKVLLSLSAGGGDAAYTIEFDLNRCEIVSDGFHFPLSKSIISWRDENSVWVCPAWDERQLTRAGYPRQVWLLTRGQSWAEAAPVYEMPADGMMVNAWRYLDKQGSAIDLIEAADGFYTKRYYQVMADGTVHPLALPRDGELVGYLYGQLMVVLRSDWHRANKSYAAGSLVAVKLHKGELGAAQALCIPSSTQAIDSIETTRRFVVANVLDNVRSCLKIWHYTEGHWQEVAAPNLPAATLEITDQPWGGDVIYFAGSDFTTPLTLYALDVQLMELSVLRRQPAQFDAADVRVQQFYAESADGTAIPYYHVARHAERDTPTLVYVYGGFAVPQLPFYLSGIGRHWLAQGHAFVLANIRGGGEFGPAWHHAAQGAYKYRSVDDLLAVVHDLARRSLTSPPRIAIQGGSNGGLVVASAFCREPQSIGAMVCEVPLTDMLRYPHLSAGASWLAEYGDPDNAAQRPALQALSPYHQLCRNQIYPPALITTSLHDDRVHPAHALKFYARLHSMNQPVWLLAPDAGGHGGNTTQADTAAELALILRFLDRTLSVPVSGAE